MMKRAILVLSVLSVAFIAKPAAAFDQAAAQAACGNDVFALCQQAVPDQGRITACLRAHQRQVSPTCRQFMAASAAELQHSARRHGSRQIETTGGAPND